MAKISKKRLDFGGKGRDFEMHYHTEKGFFVKLPEEVGSIVPLEYRQSEEAAEKHAKDRIDKYLKASLTQRKLIAIYQPDPGTAWCGNVRLEISQVSFSFAIVYENTLQDGTKAIVDAKGARAYHRGFLIPWTEEREKKCAEFCAKIDEAAQKLHEFLDSAQDTPELLDGGPLLLQ